MSNVAFLMTGAELLNGRVQDTLSRYVGEQLNGLGIELTKVVMCGDTIADISSALAYLAKTSQFIIISGGLGPTSDDLTREAVAEFSARKLVLNQAALDDLHDLFKRRGRKFDPANTKQALFPESAEMLKNPIGTAAGFCLKNDQVTIVVLPGVPKEFERMFQESVLPLLLQQFSRRSVVHKRVMRIFGVSEAQIGTVVDECCKGHGITISYRAVFPEVQVVFSSTNNSTELQAVFDAAKSKIGQEFIFSESLEQGFEESLHELLTKNNLTIAVAESCTGGMVGMHLTNISGSSKYFIGGVLTYSNEAKKKLLSVPEEVLASKGAVSAETATAMAKNVRKLFKTDLGLSITGIAGPTGGTKEKPVGTFFIGFATAQEAKASHCHFNSTRDFIRRYATFKALDTVRRYIQD